MTLRNIFVAMTIFGSNFAVADSIADITKWVIEHRNISYQGGGSPDLSNDQIGAVYFKGIDSKGSECDLGIRTSPGHTMRTAYGVLFTKKYGLIYVDIYATAKGNQYEPLEICSTEDVCMKTDNISYSNTGFSFSLISTKRPADYDKVYAREAGGLKVDTRLEVTLDAAGNPVSARGYDLGGKSPSAVLLDCTFTKN